jgi:carbonic anhydrase
MKKRVVFTCHLVTAILISAALTSHAKKVNYHAQGTWGGKCNTGVNQSPIVIVPDPSPHPSTIKFSKGYGSFLWRAQPGHEPNWEAEVLKKPAYFEVTIAGKTHKYVLKSLHFHSPGEHTIGKKGEKEGKRFAMELHLVHERTDDNSKDKAVVAILLERGAANPTLTRFLDRVKLEADHRSTGGPSTGHPSTADSMRELPAMLNLSKGYYAYDGSLTTPDCNEGVKWFILGRRATVSEAQIKDFEKHVGTPTNRALQNLEGRKVFHHR